MKIIINKIANFLFPSFCALCDCSLIENEDIHYGLCAECRRSIVVEQGSRCDLCGKPLISEKNRCLHCRNGKAPSYDRLWTLYPYMGKYRKLLSAYKFGKKLALANFLAEKVLELIKQEPDLKDAVIVPVPPRPGKVKASGWDQVDYLVKSVRRLNKIKKNEDKANISVSCCLKRGKSKTQKTLDRAERIENMKGRIYPHGTVPKTVLIIDDVITTGSTIEVCSQVLKESGAEKVFCLCLFYD